MGPLGTLATTVITVTMVTMVITPTMATMYLSTTLLHIMPPSTYNPTTPHHHPTMLLADSLEHQVDLARMVLADLDPEALVKEALARLVLVQ